jgi:hypothetical protein
MRLLVILGVLLALPIFSRVVHAQTQTLSGDALVSALRRGG